ncbi:hypothetical protein BQ9231_00536 [Cedratvirus lausannensis]|uniref:Uncharacterized protein n=1 Tax=Cedratvirus lausannensis TaxID=2023205 RepID=A0A285PXS6_9VIRU|nr:hypothetical protein BQ9231_00536 [Cedratvirus lausannensis]
MQAQTFLEERLNQAGQGEEVVLLDMYLEERSDICFVPELDQDKVFAIFEQSKRFCSEVDYIVQNLPENYRLGVVSERLERLRAAFLPLLVLSVEDGIFYYNLADEYQTEISKSSVLKILEHAFQLEE